MLVLNALVRKSSDLLEFNQPTMQHCFHPSAKHLLYRYVTPNFAGHSFRVNEGEAWYFFANSTLCILIPV